MQSNKAVRSNPAHDEVYSIQHYAIKFVSDLRQVGGFLAPREVYSIQHYAIKFVSDLRQVGGFLAPREVFLIQLHVINGVSDIYHIEIEIKDSTDRAESASYLDLQL